MNQVIKLDFFNDRPVVCSRKIAEDFSKEHRHVLRDIDLLRDVPNFGQMFFETEIPDSYGRMQRAYLIDRDGFSLLVMGFTGKEALEWKVRYIQAFRAMEQSLISRQPACTEDVLIAAMQRIKEARLKAEDAERAAHDAMQKTEEAHKRIDAAARMMNDIRENVHFNPITWREDCRRKVLAIAKVRKCSYGVLYSEIYEELEIRAHCNLDRRLAGMRSRAIEAGATKTAAATLSKQDVVAEDDKLKEIYCFIITQIAIQYGITADAGELQPTGVRQ